MSPEVEKREIEDIKNRVNELNIAIMQIKEEKKHQLEKSKDTWDRLSDDISSLRMEIHSLKEVNESLKDLINKTPADLIERFGRLFDTITERVVETSIKKQHEKCMIEMKDSAWSVIKSEDGLKYFKEKIIDVIITDPRIEKDIEEKHLSNLDNKIFIEKIENIQKNKSDKEAGSWLKSNLLKYLTPILFVALGMGMIFFLIKSMNDMKEITNYMKQEKTYESSSRHSNP